MNGERVSFCLKSRLVERTCRWKTDYAKLEYKHGYIQWL